MRLERQPMDLLILLVERQGTLVSRAEIVDTLWGPDVFVDVETGVHTAARDRPGARVAAALGFGLLAVALIVGIVRWARQAAPPADSSVRLAVLPLANLSGDPAHEYIADGLAEEMIASLGQVDPDRLSVIARTSTLAYKGTTRPVSDIGRELGAHYLLESSMRFEARRLRITSRLIRVRDGVQVWAGSRACRPRRPPDLPHRGSQVGRHSG